MFPINSVALAALILCAAAPTCAMATDFDARKVAETVSTPPKTGERLSEWLVRTAGSTPDTTALHWRVQAQRLPQRLLRDAALVRFSGPDVPDAMAQWRDAVFALPVTGRLSLATAQPLALQALSTQDPVLQDDHEVLLFARPQFVTVMTSSGQVCQVPHTTAMLSADYLRACLSPDDMAQTTRVWLAQPDGSTADFGVANWNQQFQPSVAPGAWLWAPLQPHEVSAATSSNLIRFLATQPPLEQLTGSSLHALARPVPVPLLAHARVPLDLPISFSDWGEVGLLQTPSARMAPVGDARFHFSRVWPYTRGTVMFQPVDWLEAGFRYTDIANRLYGPTIADQQTYKDKSIDAKVRLRKESKWLPELAVGVRDLGGTGLFSAEYVVANKRWGDWDASLGLGWGYLGSRGDVANPFVRTLGDTWRARPGNSNLSGGTANFSSIFKGPSAVFGGVQYTVSPRWLLKAELDGNSYQSEPDNNNQTVSSRLNLGVVYRPTPNMDWSMGVERGNRLMVSLNLHTDSKGLGGMYAPKSFDPPRPPVVAPESVGPLQLSQAEILAYLSEQTGWQVRQVNLVADTVTLVADASNTPYIQDRVDHAARALNAIMPAPYRRFVLQLREYGLPVVTMVVDRREWVSQASRPVAPSQRLPAQALHAEDVGFQPERVLGLRYGQASLQLAPSYHQILGGPDSFLLYSLGARLTGEHRFAQNTWVTGTAHLRLLDNYAQFNYTAPSDLPRVRTYQREYVTASKLTLPSLQLTHVQDLGSGHYASLYGGLLETMYGGVGGEWFYRPWQSRLAVGVDINRVRQRDFAQNLSFRDYKVNTGHASLYWDTGLHNLQATLSVGRYLAGDVGATLDVRRVFSNGVSIGAWATKTNVSAEQFGEGSFDKGIYLDMPFDVVLPRSGSSMARLVWNPLTRDGGARLSRLFALNDITRLRQPMSWTFRSAMPKNLASAEDRDGIEAEPLEHPLSHAWQTTQRLGQQVADLPTSTWLWAGGAVVAASLLDKRAHTWAQNHDTERWDRVGKATSAVPYVLAAGAGLMYTGLAGQAEATTAETALRASAYTLALNFGLRYVVGRARPQDERGSASFDGFNRQAFKSGFASNHTAVAFALATPFAQQYNLPWLYPVAAATAFGRVQRRDHWLSDTVAGAVMGYGIGSMLSDQQTKKQGMKLIVTPQSVAAHWQF